MKPFLFLGDGQEMHSDSTWIIPPDPSASPYGGHNE